MAVKQALEHVEPWIVEGSSLDALVGDLRALAAFCEEWWDHRTKRDIHGGFPGAWHVAGGQHSPVLGTNVTSRTSARARRL